RGSSYQPTHSDTKPTLAIVDASRGQVVESLPISAIEPKLLQSRFLGPQSIVLQAVTTVLDDGCVRLLFRARGRWIVWTEGQPAIVLPDPYGIEVPPSHLVLAPEGERVLVSRHLRTRGWVHIRGQGTISGEPNEGVQVALHDVESGRALWTMRATAVHDFGFPVPSISPDGRTALVGLMTGASTTHRIDFHARWKGPSVSSVTWGILLDGVHARWPSRVDSRQWNDGPLRSLRGYAVMGRAVLRRSPSLSSLDASRGGPLRVRS